jgi:hypothetical protein
VMSDALLLQISSVVCEREVVQVSCCHPTVHFLDFVDQIQSDDNGREMTWYKVTYTHSCLLGYVLCAHLGKDKK